MTDRQAYVAFNLVDRVGFATVEKLAVEYGSLVAAWEAYPEKVSRTGGEVEWEREFERAEREGVEIVTPVDPGYPRILRESPGWPLALYVKGSVSALSRSGIAIVGTRHCTASGRNIAGRLAGELAEAGWSIVSGLALGIDGEAHAGALSAKGTTVGVIGSGLDEFYPKENLSLARQIIEAGGAVVSEFPFGRPADRTTFPIRNHVVAALTKGVVAVEAPFKSGTLITTRIAAELGRTVMAFPGRIDDSASQGCLKLIRDGAILVRNTDDVLEAMSTFFPSARPHHRRAAAIPPRETHDAEMPAYSAEESLVMLHLDKRGITMDELVRLTGLGAAKVNRLTMGLRLKGFVQFLPGNRISLFG